jgi:hypothetical protein
VAPLMHDQGFLKERRQMKKIDVDADMKRSKFLIKAMVIQVALILVIMFVFWAYLTA